MSKKTKNLVIALAMVAILLIGAISAYFSATDTATNTFTVGKVDIDQTEPAWDNTDGNTPDPTPTTTPDPTKGDKFTDHDGDGIIDSTQVTPNHEFLKNPTVTNKGRNDAYVYTMVAVPKKNVKIAVTSNGNGDATASTPAAGTTYDSRLVQLFQLNKTANGAGTTAANQMQNTVTYRDSYNSAATGVLQPKTDAQAANDARSWTGVDTFNDSAWYLLDVNPATGENEALATYKNNYNVYLFAYATGGDGSKATLTKLAGSKDDNTNGASTPALFDSVTFANVVNINDRTTNADNNIDYDSLLEGTASKIVVKSFAIQSSNLTGPTDSTDAATVWNILNNQDGAYGAFKKDLDKATV